MIKIFKVHLFLSCFNFLIINIFAIPIALRNLYLYLFLFKLTLILFNL